MLLGRPSRTETWQGAQNDLTNSVDGEKLVGVDLPPTVSSENRPRGRKTHSEFRGQGD